ncbi:MAG: phosphotransferase family protein [Hoeflea sp.]|uniref:choline/ethanolamine kinase family protein n=1 Tax=Hoeflea sp. TaxID=1940281 RepID=UPI001DE5A109|nr:choline/ethanolamine kinase family protein [Hoeflea sp.]MBU4528126.1 phosphotransferase family protein [Alphaproteobacteria bacterium]MBU4543722.1 phosphotransferase family protein [Alphaproteobacteria bacterium]MBU4548589.1 phosphotransferase family protein [Alphaproteobacteria bacterium]MBV1725755.1 phosphotransferase family protein [Hoeflea sp.]MBV1762111.1 phosphotransferase family protein [Hoeflea sp.]
MTDPATLDRIRALPCFSGSVDIAPLSGGLSNENWLVTDAAGKHVVRLGRDFPFHHVDRAREVMTARAAHAAGFGPCVEYSEPGIMVTAFLNAKTFGAADVRANAERIGRLLRDFHATMPHHVAGAGFMFWVFHVIRDYARTLGSGGSRMADRLPAWLELSETLEAAQRPLPIVFGHNDLLPANFLDDGHKLWLIDFEYAGFSTAMFDIAGAASNAEMTADEAALLLEAALGSAPDPAMTRTFHAMQCASLLRETLWSLVSELHLDAPGVDYQAYTAENLARLDAALEHYHSTYGKTSS